MVKEGTMAKDKGPGKEEITIGAKETRDLPVKLSQEEINGLGRKLPVLMEEMDRIEAEKKNVVAEYAGRLKRKKAEAEVVAREIRTGETIVPIQTQWEYHWTKNRKVLIRVDTREELDSLGIQDVERQKQFPGVKGVAKDPPKDVTAPKDPDPPKGKEPTPIDKNKNPGNKDEGDTPPT